MFMVGPRTMKRELNYLVIILRLWTAYLRITSKKLTLLVYMTACSNCDIHFSVSVIACYLRRLKIVQIFSIR